MVGHRTRIQRSGNCIEKSWKIYIFTLGNAVRKIYTHWKIKKIVAQELKGELHEARDGQVDARAITWTNQIDITNHVLNMNT